MRPLRSGFVLFDEHEEVSQDVGVAAVVAVAHEVELDAGAVDRVDACDHDGGMRVPCPLFGMHPFGGDQSRVSNVRIQRDLVTLCLAAGDPFAVVGDADIGGAEDEVVDRVLPVWKVGELIEALHDDAVAHAVDDDVDFRCGRDGADELGEKVRERDNGGEVDRLVFRVIFKAALCGPGVADDRAVEGHVPGNLGGAEDGGVEADVEAVDEQEDVAVSGRSELFVNTCEELGWRCGLDEREFDEGSRFEFLADRNDAPLRTRGFKKRIDAAASRRDLDDGSSEGWGGEDFVGVGRAGGISGLTLAAVGGVKDFPLGVFFGFPVDDSDGFGELAILGSEGFADKDRCIFFEVAGGEAVVDERVGIFLENRGIGNPAAERDTQEDHHDQERSRHRQIRLAGFAVGAWGKSC